MFGYGLCLLLGIWFGGALVVPVSCGGVPGAGGVAGQLVLLPRVASSGPLLFREAFSHCFGLLFGGVPSSPSVGVWSIEKFLFLCVASPLFLHRVARRGLHVVPYGVLPSMPGFSFVFISGLGSPMLLLLLWGVCMRLVGRVGKTAVGFLAAFLGWPCEKLGGRWRVLFLWLSRKGGFPKKGADGALGFLTNTVPGGSVEDAALTSSVSWVGVFAFISGEIWCRGRRLLWVSSGPSCFKGFPRQSQMGKGGASLRVGRGEGALC